VTTDSKSATTTATTTATTQTTATTATTRTAAASPSKRVSSDAPPAHLASSRPSRRSWTIYGVDVRVGADTEAPLRRDLARLTPLPSAKQPELMFMGVMAGGRQAVFVLAAGLQHSGPGVCRPRRQVCSAILLRAGQTERFTISGSDGHQQLLFLDLVHVRSRVTHSRSAALYAYNRHSAAGQCELDLADPMSYSESRGTLSAVSGMSCRHQSAAVPFPFAVTSQ